MDRRQALRSKWHELGPLLQRKFWRPLRSMTEIFHVLPIAAALLLFVLLATDAQFREIYISYLEGPSGHIGQWLAGIVAAVLVVALISAVLCEAHFSLSTMRMNVIYSSYSNPDANSKLRSLQRTAAFCLALAPWLGLTLGLFGARNFVAERYCKLLEEMPAGPLHDMQHLLVPGGWTIAAAIVFLGACVAVFSCTEQSTQVAQRAVALVAPALAALLFLLFADWLVFSVNDRWWLIFFAVTVALTGLYFAVYQWLYRRRGGLIFSRSRAEFADPTAIAPEIDATENRGRFLAAWALSFLVAQPEISTGISMRKRRRQMLVIWAFVPWLLSALYFAIVPYVAAPMPTAETWYRPQAQSLCPIAATQVPVPGHWPIFPVAMCCTIGLGLLVGLLLDRLSERWEWRRVVTIGAVLVLASAAVVASRLLDVSLLVVLYRIVGPLGTAALQLLLLISTFALLAWLSQRSGFPVFALVILAIILCVVFPSYAGATAIALGVACVLFAATALLSRRYAISAVALILPVLGAIQWYQLQIEVVAQNPPPERTGGVDRLAVRFAFECWLRQRGIGVEDSQAAEQLDLNCPLRAPWVASPPSAAGQRYPVFLIAAEGGGIYAASAASMFLARLQQQAPRFAEHVFALSGVSGGAIGSTIFQALNGARLGQPASAAHEPFTRKVREIMQDDHFSPVVGSIFPELLGADAGRAQTLAASFQLSTAERDAAAGQALSRPFAQHWKDGGLAPALVLNATWVETGFRVAFAPFHLHDIDESLYSFSDEAMPSEDCEPHEQHGCVSLISAAGVSARFPLVLPPFSTQLPDGRRWNFVDGGYTDNSGATTALDLYQALKKVAPEYVDLQIVLITSATPQPDLRGKEISGTVFRDTIAPIAALMKVREDLGNDAVARACSEAFDREGADQSVAIETKASGGKRSDPGSDASQSHESCVDHGQNPTAHLHIVEIQDQTYGLALGWKISQTSFDVVSWMLGKPEECAASPPAPAGAASAATAAALGSEAAGSAAPHGKAGAAANAKLTRTILRRNSCVMKSIETLVEGRDLGASGVADPGSRNQ